MLAKWLGASKNATTNSKKEKNGNKKVERDYPSRCVAARQQFAFDERFQKYRIDKRKLCQRLSVGFIAVFAYTIWTI